jgi:hypothetical protein
MQDLKQFASSSNGDRWFLCTDSGTQERFVLHRANAPSGGHETMTPVQEFLNIKPFGPERESLLAMLGVADDQGDDDQQEYRSPSP